MSPAERQELQRQLAALAEGDRGAFEPVYARLWPVVRRFVAGCLPAQEAEDVAQQALLNVFSRAAAYDPQRDALGWVLGVAFWEVRTARRRLQRRREGPLPEGFDPPDEPGTAPEAALLQSDLEKGLELALGELGPRDREALQAFALDQRPPGAGFRKRLQRALARLRAAWNVNHAD